MRTTLFEIFEPEIISKRTRALHMRIGTRARVRTSHHCYGTYTRAV